MSRPSAGGGLTWQPGRLDGGHLMQRGMVDFCIVGTDRTTGREMSAARSGTYLKALAARDTAVPCFIGVPSPSIDWTLANGVAEIPIEERAAAELSRITVRAETGELVAVELLPPDSPAANPAFDVTPAPAAAGQLRPGMVRPRTTAGRARKLSRARATWVKSSKPTRLRAS